VCGTVYVTGTEKKTQGRDPLAPRYAIRVKAGTRLPRLAYSWRARVQQPKAKRKHRRALLYRRSVLINEQVDKQRLMTVDGAFLGGCTCFACCWKFQRLHTLLPALHATSSFTRESNPPLPTSLNHRAFSEVRCLLNEAVKHRTSSRICSAHLHIG
jgi:hypothetical protein